MRSKLHRAVATTVATLSLAGGAVFAPAPADAEVAYVNANPCDFSVLIGVRGFTAPSGTGTSAGGHGWTSGGYGDVPQSVVSSYNRNWSWPTYEISLNYDASIVSPIQVWDGAQHLADEINWYANTCAYGPAILLTGHSLGAAVIINLLTNADEYLTEKSRVMVRSVQLYGSPMFYAPGRSWSSGTNYGQGIFAAMSSAASNEAVTASINATFGAGFIEDNCYAEDGYCQSGRALDNVAHNRYANNEAVMGGYSLGERLRVMTRGTPRDGATVEPSAYSLPAPGSGELPNVALITPRNASEYADEIAQMTHILREQR
ncbi:cutinase family protein [Microbacterium rhizomatis]